MAYNANQEALRNSLRGFVDSNLAGLFPDDVVNVNGRQSTRPSTLLRTLQSYMSNGGAGDVLGEGRKAYEEARRRLGPKADQVLGALRGMYDDQALADFAKMYRLDPTGMSPEQFNAVLQERGFTGADARAAEKDFAAAGWNSKADQEAADAAAADKAERTAQSGFMADVQKRLQAFATRMMTYDPNDPTAKAIANVATGQAQMQAYGANTGTDRGLGAYNNASLMNDAATRYQMQRESAGVGALNNLGSLAGQNMASAQQRDQFNQGLDFQIQQYNDQGAQAAYNAQQGQRQGTGALIGGLGGAVLGGVAGGFLGGPMGAATGAGLGGQVGSGLGAGIGGMGQRPYARPSYSRTGGGGRRFNNF